MSRPYYEHGGVTIYHGDCREILPRLPRVEQGTVFGDPPYGVGKAEWDAEFQAEWMYLAAQVAPVLAVTPGICNLLHCPPAVGPLLYRWTLSAFLSNGKTRGKFGFCNWIACPIYAAEGVSLYRCKPDSRAFTINGDMPDHPSPKPFDVMRWLVSMFPGEVVIDAFMGSATTLRAAKDLGRRAIGIETEERYCELAAKRLAQEVLCFDLSPAPTGH